MPKKQQGHWDYFDPITHKDLNLPEDSEEKKGHIWVYKLWSDRRHLNESLIREQWEYKQIGSTLFNTYFTSKVKLDPKEVINVAKHYECLWIQTTPYPIDHKSNIPILNHRTECYELRGERKNRKENVLDSWRIIFYDPYQDNEDKDPLYETFNHTPSLAG